MTQRIPRDADAITRAEAAAMLGLGVGAVRRLRREGLLVEQLGRQHLYSRSDVQAFVADPWLTGIAAAEILSVSHNRVSQLANDDKIPFRLTASGRRVYRKSQLEVVANARRLRRTGGLTRRRLS